MHSIPALRILLLDNHTSRCNDCSKQRIDEFSHASQAISCELDETEDEGFDKGGEETKRHQSAYLALAASDHSGRNGFNRSVVVVVLVCGKSEAGSSMIGVGGKVG